VSNDHRINQNIQILCTDSSNEVLCSRVNQKKIKKALQYIDAWATIKWHHLYGGTGIPAEKMDENTYSSRRNSPSSMPAIFDASLMVERTLKLLGDPWIIRCLLLWIYPKSGTYQREQEIETFRPSTLKKRAKEFGWSEKRLTDLLKFEERSFLNLLSQKI